MIGAPVSATAPGELCPKCLFQRMVPRAMEQPGDEYLDYVRGETMKALGELDIDRDTAFQIFRIAQEAINNATRHAPPRARAIPPPASRSAPARGRE